MREKFISLLRVYIESAVSNFDAAQARMQLALHRAELSKTSAAAKEACENVASVARVAFAHFDSTRGRIISTLEEWLRYENNAGGGNGGQGAGQSEGSEDDIRRERSISRVMAASVLGESKETGR